jgi:hypothetical protein
MQLRLLEYVNRTSVLAAVLFTAQVAYGMPPPAVAPLIAHRARPSSAPLWVSARTAFDTNGQLRPELFENSSLRSLRENQLRNGPTCRVALGSPVLEDFTRKSSFDDLVAGALTIVEGSVASADAGFLNGIPGTLFSLNIKETYKSLGNVDSTGNVLHLFIGDATIPTPQGVICSRTLSQVPPKVGDDVVIFASVDPIDAEHRILVVEERSQIVVARLGHVYAPFSGGRWPAGCCTDIHELGSRLLENKHLHDAPPRFPQ